MDRVEIVRDTIRRFNHLTTRSIARYLIAKYGGLFDNNIEVARSAIRYQRGQQGDNARGWIGEKIIPHGVLTIPETWASVVDNYMLPVGKWLVIADLHIPFHSMLAICSALEYGKKQEVTGIFIDGDLQDDQAVTYWPTVVRKDFMGEVSIVADFLDYLRQEFPNAMIVYKPGNHEFRLPRYYAQHIPEMVDNPVLAMETQLDFESRGIEFLDYNQLVLAGKLPIVHGHEVRLQNISVNPARSLFLKINSWGMCAHLHRTSEHSAKNIWGEYLTCWSIGCLCDLKPDYNSLGNQWGWGVAIVDVLEDGNFIVENRRILPSGEVV
jgi:predicted phosphodiesterase